MQANKQASMHASKQESKQASMHAGRQASKQASKQASTRKAFSRSHALEGLVLPAQKIWVGWVGNEQLAMSWMAYLILVSALDPNPSFFPVLGDFYSTWGSVGTGAWTQTWTRA